VSIGKGWKCCHCHKGADSIPRIGLGSQELGVPLHVEENLQARDLRTRLDRKQSVCRSWYWRIDLWRNLQARFYLQRDNENIGQVARGHQEKLMVADGGKDTLYVTST